MGAAGADGAAAVVVVCTSAAAGGVARERCRPGAYRDHVPPCWYGCRAPGVGVWLRAVFSVRGAAVRRRICMACMRRCAAVYGARMSVY